MTKVYRAEAREHLKNCVGARFSAEALVIALAGGRIGQSDWSVECDRIISLLDDDADYRRGFNDGLKANTRAAFAAAKQAIPERTCRVVRTELYGQMWAYCHEFSCDCGQRNLFTTNSVPPKHCPNCGARVVDETTEEHMPYYTHDELLAEIRAINDEWAQERTCRVDGSISYDWTGASTTYEHNLTCGHMVTTDDPEPPNYCPECGARVVS